MFPSLQNGTVSAKCPECKTVRAFTQVSAVARVGNHQFAGRNFSQIVYVLAQCSGFKRGGLAKVHAMQNWAANDAVLESLDPASPDTFTVPDGIPEGILSEFREAELCAAHGAWRAASALLRSTLEKTLKANGYTSGVLHAKINDAARNGILTEVRRKRAQDEIRVLGNDVLHDEWRAVTREEFDLAHHYTQRILEDFYDDRPSVEATLIAKNRIPIAATVSAAVTSP